MIINHSKKFIFFANRKTASTSTAITLLSSCNNSDVITPLGRDEKIRGELGYQGPTNFIPWWNKINYLKIEAKSKIFKTSANRALKTIGLDSHRSKKRPQQELHQRFDLRELLQLLLHSEPMGSRSVSVF